MNSLIGSWRQQTSINRDLRNGEAKWRSVLWVLSIGFVSIPGCMSIMGRGGAIVGGSDSSAVNPAAPYAATWTDLQLATIPLLPDPENKEAVKAMGGGVVFLMLIAAIDTPLSFLLDTINLPWDIRNWRSRKQQENSESGGGNGAGETGKSPISEVGEIP